MSWKNPAGLLWLLWLYLCYGYAMATLWLHYGCTHYGTHVTEDSRTGEQHRLPGRRGRRLELPVRSRVTLGSSCC